MDQEALHEMVMTNTASQVCPLTGRPIEDPAVMHRDLSDWFPSSLQDMWDNRLSNVMLVERAARDAYYKKLKKLSIVIGFSGGLDSTTLLHWAAKLFGEVHCLTFDYGQRHKVEVDHAIDYLTKHCESLDCDLVQSVVDMSPINKLAESALTRDEIEAPRNQTDEEMAAIPNTFVPGRNVYFMTALAQIAYRRGARHIGMGVNVLDYSGYPDCRPEFVVAMRKALSIGIFNGDDIGVHAPLMLLNKVNIIRLGTELGVMYEDTHSCYNGVVGGCSECDSCILRQRAFWELGFQDPAHKKHFGEVVPPTSQS